jgi:hypothetical protein
MPFTINGTTGIDLGTQPLTGSLPDANAPSGSVIQVVQSVATDPLAISTGSLYNFVDITGLSISITPLSSASKFLLVAHISLGSMASGNTICRFVKNGTAIGVGTGSGYNSYGFNSSYSNSSFLSYHNAVISGQFLDSPATASAITYKIQFSGDYSGTMYFNRREADTRFSTISSLTVMEISA